jgi:hypothetical protein
VIEVREGRRSPYRVRRLEGKLSASFRVRAAAELQDALWRRWGDQIPVLADREPKIPPTLEARLLSPSQRELSTMLLAELLAAHPTRNEIDYPRDRANPVTLVPAPAQAGVRLVRRPYLPEIVEEIRADFLELEALLGGRSPSKGKKR